MTEVSRKLEPGQWGSLVEADITQRQNGQRWGLQSKEGTWKKEPDLSFLLLYDIFLVPPVGQILLKAFIKGP